MTTKTNIILELIQNALNSQRDANAAAASELPGPLIEAFCKGYEQAIDCAIKFCEAGKDKPSPDENDAAETIRTTMRNP